MDVHHFFNANLAWSAVNFVLLIAVLYYLNKKYIKFGEFIKNRRAEFEKELKESLRIKAEAEERFRELSMRLEDLDEEIEKIRATGMENARLQRKEAEGNAQGIAERIRREARSIAESELMRARLELRKEIIELASKKAAELVEGEFSEDDQIRMEGEFLRDLREKKIV